MAAEMKQEQQQDTVDFIKEKIQQSREDARETIDTLFYSGMKDQSDIVIVAEEYAVSDMTFPCDLFAAGESINELLPAFFNHVKDNHYDAYRIKRLVDEEMKEVLEHGITYIKGFVVAKKQDIFPFTIFSPREKTTFEWVKSGMFGKKQVEVKKEKNKDEFETEEFYYQFNISHENVLDEEEEQRAKLHITKALYRKTTMSEELFQFRKFEKQWNHFADKKEITADEFEQFIRSLHQFKEQASPNMEPLAGKLYHDIVSKQSIINQFQMIRKHQEDRLIFID